MNKLDAIDTKRSLGLIVKRLPHYTPYLQAKWRSKAVGILDETGRYPNIVKLVEFLNKAAREANDPVYGLEDRNNKEKLTMKKGSNYSIQASTSSVSDMRAEDGTNAFKQRGSMKGKTQLSEQTACPLCSGGHLLAACADFRKMSPTERLTVAR